MARDYGKIKQSIWSDQEWRDRSSEAQRVYLMALTSSTLSYAGVVPFTARRWASLSADGTERKIRAAVTELVESRHVVLDESTEELFIRSFVRNDGVLDQPNVVKAMVKAYGAILSSTIRGHFLLELHRIAESIAHGEGKPKGWDEADQLLTEAFPNGFVEGLPDDQRKDIDEGRA